MQITPELLIGAAAALAGSALYALSVVVYRSQKGKIHALAISSIKMWIALPVMGFLVLLPISAPLLSIPIESAFILAISILFGAVAGDTLYLMSQERIGVSNAFPIAMSFPILTYVLAIIFLAEPLIITRFIGAIIAVSGLVLISREQNNNEEEKEKGFDSIGVLLAVSTAILYATGTVILQVGVTDVDPISGNFIRVLSGSVAFLPIFFFANNRGMQKPSKHAVKLVLIAGFFGMGIGSLLYVSAVKYAGAAITSVLASTAPLWAVPVSIFFLKERITRLAGAGVFVTVAGVILVILGI
ncbi:MAG: DMT family transporter [Candidatus Thorarchaeota archaeon]|jgi:drug/metabolite transporter (DMT)-like permease